jgi:hypothetical protein
MVASAIAAAAGASGAADAATLSVVLQSVVSQSSSGASAANISSSTATWTYDTQSREVTQQTGVFNARYSTSPTSTLFRQTTTGLVFGGGSMASATNYLCTDGNFGPGVGVSMCGNYNFGANFANESTLSFGPGTSVSRSLGGDDVALASPRGVSGFDGLTTVSWVGTTLTLSNATATDGYTWTLETQASLPLAPPAPGFTVIMGSNLVASGIDNLDIMGTRYDVRFPCFADSVVPCPLGPGRDLFLGNRDGALAAAEAIAGALTSAGALEVDNQSRVNSGDWSHFLVPYSGTEGFRGCSPALGCLGAYDPSQWAIQEAVNTPLNDPFTFVSFTPSAVVPLPPAAWLFGGAMAGLGGLKRKRSRVSPVY